MNKLAWVSLLCGAFTAGSVCAQTEIKFGHVGEPGQLFTIAADEYAKRVNEKLGGKVKVVTFASSQLGGDKGLLQELQRGRVDIATASAGVSARLTAAPACTTPFVLKGPRVFWRTRLNSGCAMP